MSVQLSADYAPTGLQVQIQVAGGTYNGNFLGRSVEDDGYLTVVQAAQALTFTLDQDATNCKISLTYSDFSHFL